MDSRDRAGVALNLVAYQQAHSFGEKLLVLVNGVEVPPRPKNHRPFDSLIGTVRHRFTTMGIPSFPLADRLVLWGGLQEGFNGFRYRPVESAMTIDRPTLLMNGDNDPWVRPEEARAIFDGPKGPVLVELNPVA